MEKKSALKIALAAKSKGVPHVDNNQQFVDEQGHI